MVLVDKFLVDKENNIHLGCTKLNRNATVAGCGMTLRLSTDISVEWIWQCPRKGKELTRGL
jgi:hypothetical protein